MAKKSKYCGIGGFATICYTRCSHKLRILDSCIAWWPKNHKLYLHKVKNRLDFVQNWYYTALTRPEGLKEWVSAITPLLFQLNLVKLAVKFCYNFSLNINFRIIAFINVNIWLFESKSCYNTSVWVQISAPVFALGPLRNIKIRLRDSTFHILVWKEV